MLPQAFFYDALAPDDSPLSATSAARVRRRLTSESVEWSLPKMRVVLPEKGYYFNGGGGPGGTRTRDLTFARSVLYPLSYRAATTTYEIWS